MDKKVDRAAQFLPFDALKGLQEELRAREEKRSRIERIELPEERAVELSEIINNLRKGDEIKLTFFYKGHYFEASGAVTKIDRAYKFLSVGGGNISFEDIYDISVIG